MTVDLLRSVESATSCSVSLCIPLEPIRRYVLLMMSSSLLEATSSSSASFGPGSTNVPSRSRYLCGECCIQSQDVGGHRLYFLSRLSAPGSCPGSLAGQSRSSVFVCAASDCTRPRSWVMTWSAREMVSGRLDTIRNVDDRPSADGPTMPVRCPRQALSTCRPEPARAREKASLGLERSNRRRAGSRQGPGATPSSDPAKSFGVSWGGSPSSVRRLPRDKYIDRPTEEEVENGLR